jgi:hypothetical protein
LEKKILRSRGYAQDEAPATRGDGQVMHLVAEEGLLCGDSHSLKRARELP